MFTGLSAFPLTPMNEQGIHKHEFTRLAERLVEARVDSIGVLGSTGSYAYLSGEERARVAKLCVEHAAATGLLAGCDAWYSVIGGLYPDTALALTRAAQTGDEQHANGLSAAFEPLWALYRDFGGSLRVVATIAELTGKVSQPCLPQPLQTLQGDARKRVAAAIDALQLS
jgi:dihydrodipicolinate synthase/N-acetylneuraminate lyase